ncbi:hypothetical protein M0R45_034035 [Rubus argutus]|uniref:NAC domain-containing protein n=1 Tax=Rubus argutus TaxID=59490 RepID=A0AAW1VUH8_RUBAR
MNRSPNTIPKGVRFKPSDEELLSDYLEKKNQGKDSQITIIPEIHVLKHNPEELPALVFEMGKFGEREWFTMADNPRDMRWHFFSPRDYMSRNSTRSKRKTQQGYWSITSADRRIMSEGSQAEIGRKRIMTFYLHGKPKAQYRTNWILHEFYLTEAHSDPPKQKGNFVLYRLKYKSGQKKDKSDHDPDSGSCSMASNVENQGDFALCHLRNKSDEFDHAPICDQAQAEPASGSCSMASNVENQAAANAEDKLAFTELLDALQIPNVNGCLTGSSYCVKGQSDSYNSFHSFTIEELFDDHEPVNLGNVSHGTIVHDDECRKRNYPFENNDPSLTKKNNISTKDYDEQVNNTSSNSENQAAQWIPEGHSTQPGANLELGIDSFQPQGYDSAPSSIYGGPGDFSDYNYLIGLDELLSSLEDTDSSPAKSSDSIIDGGSGVSSDRNTEVVHGSVKVYSALAIGAEQHSNVNELP